MLHHVVDVLKLNNTKDAFFIEIGLVFFPRFYVDFHWFMPWFQDSSHKKYCLIVPACFFHIFIDA